MKLLKWVAVSVWIIFIQACSYLPEEQIVSDVLSVYETRDYIQIIPNSGDYAKTGFVFYPGAMVDPHSYIETLSRFAVSGVGHMVVIVKMPGNIALFDRDQGAYMYEDYPGVFRWVIGGHSLGGVMACSVVEKYPEYFRGLVLMASYPDEKTDLTGWTGRVLSLVGQNDKIIDHQKIEERALNLPPNSIFHTIEGGNHSIFGKYGHQDGDGEADISHEEHTKIIVKLIQELYDSNGWE